MQVPYSSPLDSMYAAISALAGKVGIDPRYLPHDDGKNREDALWIEEAPSGVFTRYYMERGERIALSLGSYDETLFDVMASASQDEANRRELQSRNQGEDSRQQWFAIQAGLMTEMKPEWAGLIAAKQAGTLADYPFRDDV